MPDPTDLSAYREFRAAHVRDLRAFRVTGDLIRHCDMQRSLAKLRSYFTPAR